MALRRLFSRGLPELPEEPTGLQSLAAQAMDVLPIAPVRLFWENLNEMRPWWPVLLPLLAWVGWRTYQREREAVLMRTEQ